MNPADLAPQGNPSLFPETRMIDPCSFNRCTAGHSWKPTLALAQCPGCQGPVLAVRQENCPICNEPVEFFSLRADHLPAKSGIQKVCMGEPTRGESTKVEMKREGWREIEKPVKIYPPFDASDPGHPDYEEAFIGPMGETA